MGLLLVPNIPVCTAITALTQEVGRSEAEQQQEAEINIDPQPLDAIALISTKSPTLCFK